MLCGLYNICIPNIKYIFFCSNHRLPPAQLQFDNGRPHHAEAESASVAAGSEANASASASASASSNSHKLCFFCKINDNSK